MNLLSQIKDALRRWRRNAWRRHRIASIQTPFD